VLRLQAPKGKLSFSLAYRPPREAQYRSPDYQGSATTLAANDPVDWLCVESAEAAAPASDVRAYSDAPECLMITGRNGAGPSTPAGLTFALRIKVVSDGSVAVENGRMFVHNAQTAVLLICAATNYVSFENLSADPVAKVRLHTDNAARESYETLRQEHIREYRSLYASVSLDLPATVSADKPTDVRIADAEIVDDPALAALYFQFARYLLISSSRAGCQPANLQGIWNEGTNPPWGSKYTININTEMNYWPADAAGLGACVEPLLRMVEDLAVTGARTAKVMYGARGWVAHHNTDLWRATAPIDGPLWGLWPCGGAWLCNTLWDHYDYSRDERTLQRIYPLMRGASLFFLDTMVEDPKGRGLVTSPSISPENRHPFGSSLCAGPAMDRQIIRDLFAHTIEAGKKLRMDDLLLGQIAAMAHRIAPDAIGKSGQLQEWLEDWDDSAPEQHHRHVSHLYAVYPSSQVNVRDTVAFIDAAKTSLSRRGDLATGWGTAWRLCLWARMGQGDHAYTILKSLLGPRRTYPNMFDAHPPFQIDGNFGGAAGIMEMVVQSWGDEIRLLPALPGAWSSGEARGIRARGAISVSLGWRAHRLSWLELAGPALQAVELRYGDVASSVVLDARGHYRMSR
jgi:alpha-L-fucosidase 2